MNEQDGIRYSSYPDREKGGQHVGVECGIKGEHIDTGLIAISTIGRSQHRNRMIVQAMIEEALTNPSLRVF